MKFRLFLRSYRKGLLEQTSENLKKAFEETNSSLVTSKVIHLPRETYRFCVLRAPHADKDSRELFEMRSYKCFFDVTLASPDDLEDLLKQKIPHGVTCCLIILKSRKIERKN